MSDHPAGDDALPPGAGVVALDPWLRPHIPALVHRYETYCRRKAAIEADTGSVASFALAYKRCGFERRSDEKGLVYREWAPHAQRVRLIGDFNGWDRSSDRWTLTRDEFGWWTLELSESIPHGSRIKVEITTADGSVVDRLPAWSRWTQQAKGSPVLDALFYDPPQRYTPQHARPARPKSLRIYEAHVGICTEDERVATYDDFTKLLPYVARCGYNAVQLMAVMEHAYYASFGYHVNCFFAPASRFGPPEALARLVDEAHRLGLVVLLDLVHAHASRNVLDGLNQFDGSDNTYFHAGPRGVHSLWDSRMFDYGSHEVLRFLLSNLRFWMDEFGFDGFRFDGITAMMYHHRGIAVGFSGGYHEYFNGQADEDAIAYLMLANEMLHAEYPYVITIAEDVSGMPALCRPVAEGGLGFDYRLSMGIPDLWETMVQRRDEDWDMGRIVFVLTNRRHLEPVVSYAESHDQAIVGSKTLAFWLMDKEMYTGMSVLSPLSLVVDRGIALHKLIRLITLGLGGQAYLNFMGNEFGHPEWIDFPRQGNGDSFKFARRQWHLVEDGLLRYRHLAEFDRAMLLLEQQEGWLQHEVEYVSSKHEGDKVLAFERAGLLFVFSFHPTSSFTDYRVGVGRAGRHALRPSCPHTARAPHSQTAGWQVPRRARQRRGAVWRARARARRHRVHHGAAAARRPTALSAGLLADTHGAGAETGIGAGQRSDAVEAVACTATNARQRVR